MMRSTSRRPASPVTSCRERLAGEAGQRRRLRRGVEDGVARGIVDRDAQVQRLAGRGGGLGARGRGGDAVRQAVRRPITVRRTPLLARPPHLVGEIEAQQRHQRGDLGLGPAPVVGGEGVERRRADALPGRGLDHAADRLDAGLVAAHARQAASRRPAAVAVHDDADMQLLVLGGEVLCIAKSSGQKGRVRSRGC